MIELLVELVSVLLKIAVFGIVCLLTKYALPWLQDVVVPWLKERQLYGTICHFVRAAEKLAESGAIERTDKKEYVVSLLKDKGITVTREINAMIESAVMDLDLTISGVMDKFMDAFLQDEDDELDVQPEGDEPTVN